MTAPGLFPRIFDAVGDTTAIALPGRFRSTSITNAAMGGYLSMASRYDASEAELFRTIDYLGKKLEVKDIAGRLAWQGLLTEAEIHLPGIILSYSLDDVANAVKVVYSGFEDDGEEQLGNRTDTAWATDAASIADYGRIEAVLSLAGVTDSDAQLHRDRYLGLYARPLPAQRMSNEKVGRGYAWLRGRGYWYTCDWQVYNQTATGSRATNTQIEDIVTAECPLIASTDVVATSNSIERYRDANQTAWGEILRLAALGDSSNNPLVVGVWAGRELVVETLPTTPDYVLWRDGRYTDVTRAPVEPWMLKAGSMMRLPQVVPGAAEFSTELNDPRNMIIKQVSYSEDSGRATITPLDAKDLAGLLMGQLQQWR